MSWVEGEMMSDYCERCHGQEYRIGGCLRIELDAPGYHIIRQMCQECREELLPKLVALLTKKKAN